jgi:hypothetical protein
MRFTATATDETSLMDKVMFYLNEGHQSTVSGLGPTYQWEFVYHQDFSVDIKAIAYDQAGNFAEDIVEDPKPTNYNNFNINQYSMKLTQ